MTPEVTAIVTCMTDAERPFLRDALQSIQSQTRPCETILLVETSSDWAERLAGDFPDIRILRMPLAPVGAVRNAGIAAAKTEFVALLDGDDVWMPDKISRQLAFLREHGGDFVGVDFMLMTEEGEVFAYGSSRYMAMPSGWMARREMMLRHPFDPDAKGGTEDGIWWRETWGKVPKFRLPEPLMRYRVRKASLSSQSGGKRRKLALANMSTMPMAKPLLLAGTYVLFYTLGRRMDYVAHRHWQLTGSSAAGYTALVPRPAR